MTDFLRMQWLPLGTTAIFCALTTYCLLQEGALVHTWWKRYSTYLARHFSFLFIDQDAQRWAGMHICICVAWLFFSIAMASWSLALLAPVLAVTPAFALERQHNKKRTQISDQLATWLTILANSLKSSPNIADAFSSSIGLVNSPLKEELALMVKEIGVGEHLDGAMRRSAARLDSPLYSSVMTTLLVARQTGGDLPKVLEGSSATLREMERLSGVVRTKTAEGRSQVLVLVILPFLMIAALQKTSPEMIPGLAASFTGKLIIAASAILWLSSLALARRIVRVDI